MAVEILTAGVKPLRNTFMFLEKRFGDKPATRYQEFAYDTQPEVNFHYKPLWDPDREIYDKRRTVIVMDDWYALKDPRQYYYGSYTIARAKLQDAIDKQSGFVEAHGLLQDLPSEAKDQVTQAIVALRHYEWGANLNNAYISAYGWGTAITQAALLAAMDRLGMAQHLSRIGLLMDGKTGRSLESAKQHWEYTPAWQSMRQLVEDLFVERDWSKMMVVQNLVADGLVYPMFYQKFDVKFSDEHGTGLSSLLDYLLTWQKESARWVDAVVKTMAAESEANREVINGWVQEWYSRVVESVQSALAPVMSEELNDAVEGTLSAFNTRLKKLGLEAV